MCRKEVFVYLFIFRTSVSFCTTVSFLRRVPILLFWSVLGLLWPTDYMLLGPTLDFGFLFLAWAIFLSPGWDTWLRCSMESSCQSIFSTQISEWLFLVSSYACFCFSGTGASFLLGDQLLGQLSSHQLLLSWSSGFRVQISVCLPYECKCVIRELWETCLRLLASCLT